MADHISPFRQPMCFGLAGVMRAEVRVFHEVLFDIRAVGRVSDLFAARLKRAVPDDLEFRASILFGVLDSYRVLAPSGPIRVECGVDGEKLGISVVFPVNPDRAPKFDGMVERVSAPRSADRFEQMLQFLQTLGDHVLYKYQPSTGMAEVCVLAVKSRGALSAVPRSKGKFELIVLPSESFDSPPVAESVALGDLDYSKLLGFDAKNADGSDAPPTGEVLRHLAADAASAYEAVRLKKYGLVSDNEAIRVSGGADDDDSDGNTRVKGVTSQLKTDNRALTIEGDASDAGAGSDSSTVVAGGDDAEEGAGGTKRFSGGADSDTDSDSEVASDEVVDEAPPKKKGIFKRLFSAFSDEEDESTLVLSDSKKEGASDSDGEPQTATAREFGKKIRELEKETEDGSFSKFVDRVDQDRAKMKEQLKNKKAEKWVDGLAADLVSERARLAEMTKNLAQSARQKELEFKNRENTMMQAMREKEEALRVKTMQLMRSKDQVAKLQMSVERAKKAGSGNEESASRIKLGQTQRLLQSIRSENEQMTQKMQEMRLKVEQLNEQRKLTVPNTTHVELQRKFDRLKRQFDEMKRKAIKDALEQGQGQDDDSSDPKGGGSKAA